MSYQVLARKYRPASFKALEGQEHVLKALVNALDNNRLHHAYLFTGTRGVGKTTIARILAKCLNCEAGITAAPCNECRTCVEIAEGRSVDVLEVDAASKTGIDDMRELLDNVQYMPTSSRFKIYLIDEVHMLSKPAFNAMLKTLEEPPEHVKFLFATTDPKKLPITILSRCLQFNLKNLSPQRIVSYLQQILQQEAVTFEDGALWQLGRAAAGSMRDALSLTDQAISYGQGALSESDVSAMLGTIDQQSVYRLLDGLISKDGAAILATIAEQAEFSPDFSALLDEILAVLHRIATAQLIPGSVDNSQGDKELIDALAAGLGREDVQLYYQIALIGKRDLSLAPDPQVGFEMIMLRMLAFDPVAVAASAPQTAPPGGTGGGAAGGPQKDSSPISGLLKKINEGADTKSAASSATRSTGSSGNAEKKTVADLNVSQAVALAAPVTPAESAAKLPASNPVANPVPDTASQTVAGLGEPSAQQVPANHTSGPAAPVPLAGEEREGSGDTRAPEQSRARQLLGAIDKDKTTRKKTVSTPGPALDSVAKATGEPKSEPVPVPLGTTPQPELMTAPWDVILTALPVTGVTQTLAMNCVMKRISEDRCELVLDVRHESLMNSTHEKRLAKALSSTLGGSITVAIAVGAVAEDTPADIARQRAEAEQAQAVAAIEADENVQSLIASFNGVLDTNSISPLAKNSARNSR